MNTGNFFQRNYNIIIKFAAVFFLLGAVVFLSPKSTSVNFSFTAGELWKYPDLYAPFDFPVSKSQQQLNQEKSEIAHNAVKYYNFDINSSNLNKAALINSIDIICKNEHIDTTIEATVINAYTRFFDDGIITTDERANYDDSLTVICIEKNIEGKFSFIKDLHTPEQIRAQMLQVLNRLTPVQIEKIISTADKYVTPNVLPDKEKTEMEVKKKLASLSESYGMVQKGELIISEGSIVDKSTVNVIESLQNAYSFYITPLKGKVSNFLIYLLICYGFMLLLLVYKPSMIRFNKSFILILTLIAGFAICISMVSAKKPDSVYIIPICMIPIIFRAFYNYRIALWGLILTLALSAFTVKDGVYFCISNLLVGVVITSCMLRLEKRSQYFIISFITLVLYILTYILFKTSQTGDFSGINITVIYNYVFNAVILLSVFPLIFIIEKIFGYTTDISLIELSNTNTKLLRELSTQAPGTFQHAIQVANLAENAAIKIGADVLLVRVGALYHDIGKMDIPSYFTENQVKNINPHEALLPDQSAKILMSHVVKGLEIATKYHLPEIVKNFIRTHHGTRFTSFFYRKAIEMYGKENIDENDYKYRGPKPFNKETAIVMMADSVEAASKSITSPDEQHIEYLVNNVIDKQISEKQFDNCNISLKDIEDVKKVFITNLKSSFHLRIKYPEQ